MPHRKPVYYIQNKSVAFGYEGEFHPYTFSTALRAISVIVGDYLGGIGWGSGGFSNEAVVTGYCISWGVQTILKNCSMQDQKGGMWGVCGEGSVSSGLCLRHTGGRILKAKTEEVSVRFWAYF